MNPKFSFDRGTRRTALWAILGALSLAACSTYNGVTSRIAAHITPYRVTIVQGNFVSRDSAQKLQVGMTRAQVRAVLGTPLLTDMFHTNRWDYIFYFKRGSTNVVQQRDLVVYFDGDRLTHWTGAEDLPTEQDLIADIDGIGRENSRHKEIEAAAADAKAARAADAAAAGTTATPAGTPEHVVTSGPQSPVPSSPQPPQFTLHPSPAPLPSSLVPPNATPPALAPVGSGAASLLPNQPLLAPTGAPSAAGQ